MKLYEAKSIITDVFENPFEKDKFSYFTRNLLKNLHSAEFRRTGYNIPKAFEDFIASYERLGKYEDEEGNLIDVLIVKLKRKHSIDYARSTQRNFVRWYLNDKGKDAALVAFHTEKSSEWRFSFIKMQYSLEKKKDELTPAKRSSFMVGESGNRHTAERQLIDLLKNDHAPFLSDIEDAFSIEAVSDEFYEKYKALLFNLVDEIEKIVKKDNTVKEEFDSKNISILNFSKKLLGQIVFLYFLQKKGWLGLDKKEKYGEGDKNFLRSLYNKTKPEENFFNDYLEYLFYDALSEKRVTDYYERFKTHIPFLNGGLFDPIAFYDWQHTDIIIPNKIFSDRKSDEEGTGILDVFDLYNFTVKEDEPLETEVAIDPEMLGKVFERMLDVTERKSKGAFYTPREVVHYMAQHSLLYYLETELQNNKVPEEDIENFIHYGEHIIDKDIAIEEGKLKQTANKQSIPERIRKNADTIDKSLKNIKICDPAVGSGAFPVGIMNEIVKLRKLLTPFLKKESADERSAYRFKTNAIQNSIYGVDIDAGAVEIAKLRLWLSMVVDEERIDTIEPLPNLEYKIVQGNSLINMPDGFLRNGDLEKHIEELTGKYKTITDKEKKQEQKEIIDGKMKQLLASASEFAGYVIDFDFKLYFHEVWNEKKGFDVVLGNPPYVSAWEMTKNDPDYRTIIKKAFPNYKEVLKGHWDLFIPFILKGFDINNNSGSTTFILPNPVLREKYANPIRKYLLENTNLISILHFDESNVFKNVSRKTAVLFISQIIKSKDVIIFRNSSWGVHNSKIYLDKTIQKQIFHQNEGYKFTIDINPNTQKILKRIDSLSFPLGSIYYVNYGAQVSSKIPGSFKKKDVVSKMPSGNSKRFIEGKDIARWKIRYRKLWLDYRKQEMYGPRSESLFENSKIIIRKVSDKGHKLALTIDYSNFYTDDGCVIALPYECVPDLQSSFNNIEKIQNDRISIKLITGLLLNKVADYYFKNKFATESLQGATSHTYPKSIRMLPIFDGNTGTLEIEILVDYILFLKSQATEKMSFYFEQLIDGIVYELYFENEIKQAGCDILKYLDDLPEITDEMNDEEKMKIITKVFNKLYDKKSPVRKNLEAMEQVDEVNIIKESLEK